MKGLLIKIFICLKELRKQMQKKKSARHLNKVAELAAALLLSASPLAGTFQSAAFVQAASQETVSPRSASRAALTKYLQQEQRYNAKNS
ncbi:proteinase b [Lactobacillus delbrueckii subsp. jakobsenii ZN7a-9 = DSM 26046]|nr:proteinase b [Lactobacillus delbrueckii subsp. jakobsenii ZN7a-9 = DSM 26046]